MEDLYESVCVALFPREDKICLIAHSCNQYDSNLLSCAMELFAYDILLDTWKEISERLYSTKTPLLPSIMGEYLEKYDIVVLYGRVVGQSAIFCHLGYGKTVGVAKLFMYQHCL